MLLNVLATCQCIMYTCCGERLCVDIKVVSFYLCCSSRTVWMLGDMQETNITFSQEIVLAKMYFVGLQRFKDPLIGTKQLIALSSRMQNQSIGIHGDYGYH